MDFLKMDPDAPEDGRLETAAFLMAGARLGKDMIERFMAENVSVRNAVGAMSYAIAAALASQDTDEKRESLVRLLEATIPLYGDLIKQADAVLAQRKGNVQ